MSALEAHSGGQALPGLQEEILEGAVYDSRGSFTLAEDKAREKMRRFQLDDPRKFLLQVIQALVAAEAGRIDVEVEEAAALELPSYRLRILFDGPGYRPEELEDLYGFIFKAVDDRLRELALGVLSCQGVPALDLEIRSNGATWSWSGGRTEFARGGGPPGNRFAAHLPGRSEDARLLREFCQAVPIPLAFNGQVVNTPHRRWAAAVPWPAMPARLEGAQGVVGLPYKEMETSRLAVYRHGVQICSRRLSGLRPPVAVALEHHGLRKNVSQTDVVEDETWRDVVGLLPSVVADLAVALARREAPPYHREEVRAFLMEALREWLPPEVVLGDPAAWPPEVAALADARLFADRKGARVSLRQIREAYVQDGRVYVCARRMPYAPLGDWLLLNPSPEERAVLEGCFRLADVDAVLQEIMDQGGGRPAVLPEPALPMARLREGPLSLILPNRLPDGRCRLFWGSGESLVEFPMRGWSVDVVAAPSHSARHPVDRDHLLLLARTALETRGRELFSAILQGPPLALDYDRRFWRVCRREHLLTFWRWQVQEAFGEVPPGDMAERVALARRILGAEAWQSEALDTRAGATVSLADVEAWVAGRRPVVVAVGGPRRGGDHALDASPALADFLARVFGPEAVQQATLRQALGQVEQSDLASAAEGGVPSPEPPPPWESADPPGVRQAPPPVPEAADPPVPEVAPVPAAEATPTRPPAPEPEATAPASGPAATAEDRATPLVLEPDRTPPGAGEPPGEGGPPEPPGAPDPQMLEERARLSRLPCVASHAFQEGGLEGYLAVALEPAGVLISRGAASVRGEELLNHPVTGWVAAAPQEGREPGSWSPEEERILLGQLEVLADRLAEWVALQDPESPPFAVGRARLVRLLSASASRVLERLEAAAPHDPVVRLRFLPLLGGGLGSLLDLWPEVQRWGYLPVCHEMWPEMPTGRPVALVGRVPEDFYRRVFRRTGKVRGGDGDSSAHRLLLSALRELRQARARGDYRLSEAVIDGVEWSEAGGGPVAHDPGSGRTFVNGRHPAVRALVARCDADPSAAALLASAIFSAVNRALEDVGDEDEIRFLEALLETAPGA